MSVVTQPMEQSRSAALAPVVEISQRLLPPVFVFSLLGILSLYNLAKFPVTWFDEGVFLVAARTLAQTGHYGTQSSDGIKLFDSMVTTGPTMIAPVALVFKLLGVGLLQARLVAVAYLMVGTVGLYRVAGQLYGRTAALVAVLAFIALGEAGPIANGRNVLGEIAALAYLFWGASVLITAQQKQLPWLYLASGLLLGLSVLTKNQFFILGPILIGIFLAARLRNEGLPFTRMCLLLVALALPTILWFGYQFATLGPAGFAEQVRGMLGQAGVSGIVGPFRRTQYSIHFLASSPLTVWGIAALAYVWLSGCRDGSNRHPERLLLVVFATVWLVAYVLLAMGWARYAVATVGVCAIFTGKLVTDIANRVASGRFVRSSLTDPLSAGLVLLVGATLASGIFVNAWEVARARDDTPQRFTALVENSVPVDAVVESMEWEVSFLSDRSFHRPPVDLVVDGQKSCCLGAPASAVDWYQASPSAAYLVTGPTSNWIGVYKAQLRQGDYQPVDSIAEYTLYRRID